MVIQQLLNLKHTAVDDDKHVNVPTQSLYVVYYSAVCVLSSLFHFSTSNLFPQSRHSTTGLKMHEIIPMSTRVKWREIMLSRLTLFLELLASPSPLQRASVFNIVWDYLISSVGVLPNYCPWVFHWPVSNSPCWTKSSWSTQFALHCLLC